MARKPRTVKPDSGMVRVTVLLDGDVVRDIDAEAEKLSESDPDGRAWTRTDVMRVALRHGLATLTARRK